MVAPRAVNAHHYDISARYRSTHGGARLRYSRGMTRQPHFRPLASTASRQLSTARVLTAMVMGEITQTDPTAIVNRHWPTDAGAQEYFDDLTIRSATVPADTTTSGWASQLAPTAVGAFLSGLAPQSAAVRLFERCVKLNFDGVYQYTIPRASTSAEPVFVAELGPMPISQDVVGSVTVGPTKKMLLGAAISGELEAYSAESAVAIVSAIMNDQAGKSLDAAVFSTTAASALRPAGLMNGVTGQTATAGGGLAAMGPT
jgi:hypothetical protein